MTRWALVGWLGLAFLGAVPGASEASRSAAVELRSPGGSLGQLPLVADNGALYVSAERLAYLLRGSWTVKGTQAMLSVGKHAAQFTRNQQRVVLAGQALSLDTPPRLGESGWLIPEDFLSKGLAKLAPGVTAARVSVPAPKTPVRAGRASAAFEDLRFRSYPSFTRVVIEMAGALPYTVATEKQEIKVRVSGLGLAGTHMEEIADGLVKEMRLEPAGADAVLRVLLEGTPGEVKPFVLQDPFRVVVDIYRPKEPVVRNESGSRPAAEPLRLIVLDAGHGGHDSGAVGPTGLAEKDVVLDVTRRVARMAEDKLGVKVVLTRTTDVFVPLRERTNFANRLKADLFVSIHANAHPRSVSEGVETYFLSSEATDNEARQVAARENEVIQLESPVASQRAEILKGILWDLAHSEFQEESSVLAETVQDSMTRSLRLVNRGVKQAGFYVLGGAAMPAILIEVGFLTNPREERKLAAPEHRDAIARAIYAGLAEFKGRYDQRMRVMQTQPAKAERPR